MSGGVSAQAFLLPLIIGISILAFVLTAIVGSITFCGSLWHNGFEGPVSRLLENVVRQFQTG